MIKKIYLPMLIGVLLVGCGGGSTPVDTTKSEDTPTSTATTPAVTSTAFDAPAIEDITKQTYLDAINDARAIQQDCGAKGMKPAVPALSWSDELYLAAYEHSEDLAESDTFAHDGSGTSSDWTAQIKELGRGSTAKDRIENNGYINWRNIGENITAGTDRDTAVEAVQSWLDSPPHCANLMNAAYKDVGMGHVEKAGTRFTHYWTQNFGSKQ